MITLESIVKGSEYFFGCYSIFYILVYIILAISSYIEIKKYYINKFFFHNDVIIKSNNALGVSIVAPAFNEGLTIISNVKSLLSQEYPKFEVVIINDGSTDDTLEKLIHEFELVKVDYFYNEKIKTEPVRGHYRSSNPVYNKLLVVDKENGKSKADASNAGINSTKYSLFICTDVDCILRRDTIAMLVKPFLESNKKVIAAGAALRISNSCTFKEGMLYESHYPDNFFARFQELEYIRSFIFGRMAWSKLNGLLLVSGGLGIFDKDTVIAVGGYWNKSLGEDLELITRMRAYMHENKKEFEIKYIPESLCWTEVPDDKKVFLRQRVRWARGLIQTLFVHRKLFLNPKYKKTGLIAFPYYVFCEFLVPTLEVIGLIFILLNLYFFGINLPFLLIVALSVYSFYVVITLISIFLDQMIHKQYSNQKEVIMLLLMVFIEPIIYHPINVYASLKGYLYFLIKKEKNWGNMSRKGFKTVT